jgi:pilus assembly protein Flp/PilA
MMNFINTQIVKAQAAVAAREEGQAMVEYGLILVLVSVVAIAALGTIGGDLVTKFTVIGGTTGLAHP